MCANTTRVRAHAGQAAGGDSGGVCGASSQENWYDNDRWLCLSAQSLQGIFPNNLVHRHFDHGILRVSASEKALTVYTNIL